MRGNLSSPQAAMRVATLQLLCAGSKADAHSAADEADQALPGPPKMPDSDEEPGQLPWLGYPFRSQKQGLDAKHALLGAAGQPRLNK